uniref:U4/U6 small nuclear ribonucleoprotein Prp31 n=1 Tax=Panagrolaimus davidi TaxID=227884 RepID=A0A914PJH9_9BILA
MDPQYILVVSLSELAAEIDQEVQAIHKFIRDKYEKRFPELESLVMMPFDYTYYPQKATKIIVAECTLSARVNSLHDSSDGGIGRDLSAQIQQKLDKMLEPAPVKNNKALPKPLDIASKKRGGRLVCKTKEMMGITELQRKTNRMNFGELQADVSQEHIGFTLNQAASTSLAGGGRIRGSIVDNKTRMQRQLERQRQQLGGATSIRSKLSGTQSISFTPVQGLEIVYHNPNQQPASS